METVQELQTQPATASPTNAESGIQGGAFLLGLSLDWIVLRASENIHRLLGESHVTLVNEPLGRFVHSAALHDLRNLFSRLSGTTGIARAYRIRLTDEADLFDIAFQQRDDRVLLEIVPAPAGGFGEAFGTVGGLIAGLADSSGQALLDGGARRMRALTGFDRVSLLFGGQRADSKRGAFAGEAEPGAGLPALIADTAANTVPVFPRDREDSSIGAALLHAPNSDQRAQLDAQGVRATLRTPFTADGEPGEFRCDSRTARHPSLELHAAAELFAQLFALRLEIDRLKNG